MGALRSDRTLRYMEVVRTLAERDFVSGYRGNLFGATTTLAVPALFLLVYGVVFSTLIPVELRPHATRTDYAFFLFSGLVGWNIFAETTTRAPRLFQSQASLVRKALFPVSALPLAAALTAYYRSLIWLAAFAVANLALRGNLPASLLLAPLILALVALFAAGVALFAAAFGAFMRDLAELVGPILIMAMFLSPVLYPAERIASISPWLVRANPMAAPMQMLHATLFDGVLPDAADLLTACLWSAAALAVGIAVHRRIRPVLSDLL